MVGGIFFEGGREDPCTVRPLNILHFLFYIQKQKKPSNTRIFLFLFKNLLMQNLNLCKTHRLLNC